MGKFDGIKKLNYKIFLIICLLTIEKIIVCMNTETPKVSIPESSRESNMQNLQNILNLNDSTINTFSENFNQKIYKIKIRNNFLIIKFHDYSTVALDLTTKEFVFKNQYNLTMSKDGTLLFSRPYNKTPRLINTQTNEVIINFTDKYPCKAIFSDDSMYLLVTYGGWFPDADLYFIPEKKVVSQFKDVIGAKFIKNGKFLLLRHGMASQLIKLKNLKRIGLFCGGANLSKTGNFLYGKIKPKKILGLFNPDKMSPLMLNIAKNLDLFENNINPSCLNKLDKGYPHLPRLVNLKNNKILETFENWGTAKFSNDENFCVVDNFSDKNPKHAKLIDLERNKAIKIFKDISILKFTQNSKFYKLRFTDDSNSIVEIEKDCDIAKFEKDINCGITDDFIWLQDKKHRLTMFKIMPELKSFKKNLFKNKNKFCDTKIKVMAKSQIN